MTTYDPQAYAALALFFFLVLPLFAVGQKARAYRVVKKSELDTLYRELRELRTSVQQLQSGLVVREQNKQMRFDFVKQQEPEYWYSAPVWDDQSKLFWRQCWPIRDHLQYMSGKFYVLRGKRRVWVDELAKGDVEVERLPFTWERVDHVKRTARKGQRLHSRVR